MPSTDEPEYCGIGIRGVAIAVDSFVWFALLFVTLLPVAYVTGDLQVTGNAMEADLTGGPAAAGLGLWLALALGYHTLLEWRYGKTVGKYLVGVQVARTDGTSPTFLGSLLRNVARLVDFLPVLYLVGILLAATSSKHRRLGDRLGGTAVIRS